MKTRFHFLANCRIALCAFLVTALIVTALIAATVDSVRTSVQRIPKNGYVPDAATATRVAEAIWLPIYGSSIYDHKPFVAEIVGDSLWHVTGRIPASGKAIEVDGGVIHAWIRKRDCCILGINREK